MTPDCAAPTEFTISLTEEERAQLATWLEDRLRRTLIEEHRTDSSSYRQHILHQEEILETLLQKLQPH